MANLGFGTAKESPWRAGSNENTIFTVSHDVIVQGKPLAAGSYGLSMIPGQDEWTIIFSKNSSAWGSFFYDPSQDALRVTTKPHKNDYREWLTYEFTVRKPTEATVELQWEDLAIPMTIQVENANDIYIALLRDELTSSSGFSYQAFSAAAQFCVQANTHLEQGLEWASAAIDRPFIGQKNFETYAVKGLVLAKMGKDAEADKAMWDSVRLPGTTAIQVDELGQVLLNEKRNEKAMEVFKFNVEHNGDVWPVHEGLARGYSATGDIKQALEQAQKALPQAPDDANRKAVEKMIKTLSEGKPIGQ
jgi:tetratricopeptide (TPR) repeat protein